MAEAKILTPDLPPESTYPVQLTLTRFEAEVLARLTMVAVLWTDNDFCQAIENIHTALTKIRVREAQYGTMERLSESNRTWVPSKTWSVKQ